MQHRNAGAPDHAFKAVGPHEFKQGRSQGHDHAAVAVLLVDATAPEFDHALAQAAQSGEVELGVGIGAPYPPGLRGCQHPVGSHHFPRVLVAYQEMLAIIVEEVHIVARMGKAQRNVQSGAHFMREHLITQALCRTNLIQMLGPHGTDFSAMRWRCSKGRQAWVAGGAQGAYGLSHLAFLSACRTKACMNHAG